jgi:ankyrin repeat protein
MGDVFSRATNTRLGEAINQKNETEALSLVDGICVDFSVYRPNVDSLIYDAVSFKMPTLMMALIKKCVTQKYILGSIRARWATILCVTALHGYMEILELLFDLATSQKARIPLENFERPLCAVCDGDSGQWITALQSQSSGGNRVRSRRVQSDGRLRCIKKLMRGGVRPITFNNGTTIMMHACMYGLTPLVEFLIEMNRSICAVNVLGRTALMYACMGGYEDIVKILLAFATNPSAIDHTGNTAYSYAVKSKMQIADKLLTSVNLDNMGFTELRKYSYETSRSLAVQNAKLLYTAELCNYLDVQTAFNICSYL